MNCLFCQAKLSTNLTFHELFLLKNAQQSLCKRCLKQFEKIPNDHCPNCFKPDNDKLCKDCQAWESRGQSVNHRAIFQYNTAMHDFFSNYKFLGDYRLRFAFASYFKQIPKNYTIVPIPVSSKRFQERGFNQVTAFLDAAKISYQMLLEKEDSIKQSSLTREERLKSDNPFLIKDDSRLPQKICLVDDIYTTGATLQHASTLLKNAGVSDIISFSLCR